MCRFVAYLGQVPTVLQDVLRKPNNSLINQSLHARKIEEPVNADGFGIGWYQRDLTTQASRFKSIQPAWNDKNLHSLAKIISSKCFLGHVRRSTHGDVSRSNCHPFVHKEQLFCHNGGIEDFNAIQRHLRQLLSDELYLNLHGQTDSEHFFALMIDYMLENPKANYLEQSFHGFQSAINMVKQLQRKYAKSEMSELNTVITNGKEMMATRYRSTEYQKALSLYYTQGGLIHSDGNHPVIEFREKEPDALIIASEPLSDYGAEWREVPVNHAILVNSHLAVELKEINTI